MKLFLAFLAGAFLVFFTQKYSYERQYLYIPVPESVNQQTGLVYWKIINCLPNKDASGCIYTVRTVLNEFLDSVVKLQKPISLFPDYKLYATAICRDGTYSFSRHRQGTCSHHGGVAVWLY